MALELFVFPPSPRAFKVMAVANHLGLDWTLRMVDLTRGDQRAPDYVSLNPNMHMPTLRHDDYVLWEANAIAQYLALLRPESGLLPADARARLDVSRWQFWDLAHLEPAYTPFIFENVVKQIVGAGEPDPAALARAAEPFHRTLHVLETQLRRNRYVTGDTLTLADFSLGAAFVHAAASRLPLDRYGETQRWYAGLAGMPAWQKTLAMTNVANKEAA
jgi:glutathione S-transferase